ncbi:protein O-mannosyl-transferase Tmtc3-like [Daphnia pulicaria]|uniref:protein O-mannosyl-transferase Tmtc3-like n=1 Tax=Daphnia pulicaria TaxID=35523 RepID=UPI001EEC0E66|nr:protein O-mannosyl-transferase Tmtc3-like [Daphnia pulicaria]XP_046643730.1 protein O-mannosyl-transferase Tmtc3-like [Daphnia pulicaria]
MADRPPFALWLPSVIVCAVAAAAYWNALQCGFVFDDISAIKDNKDLRPHTPVSNLFFNDFWGTLMTKEQSHKSYRPLTVLTFRLNYLLHQLEPWGYHATNVLLHAAVCLLYLRLCVMFLVPSTAFVAALLFAVHPIHTEAVTGVVGRAELLSAAFSLVAFLVYSKSIGRSGKTGWSGIAVTIALVTCGMLCKEQGITVVGICLIYDLCVVNKLYGNQLLKVVKASLGAGGQLTGSGPSHVGSKALHLAAVSCGRTRSIFPRTAVLTMSTLALLGARMYVMGSQLPVFTRFDNPASASSFPSRHLTYNYLAVLNAWLLTFPSSLCCDWTMGTVALVESMTDPRNLATLLFFFLAFRFVWAAFFQGDPVIIMAFSWMVLPFLPASNLFFPVGFVVAERVLYIPSMGFCIMVAYGWSKLAGYTKPSWTKAVHLGFLLLFVFHGLKTYTRNFDWESEQAIFSAGLRVNQRNAKLFNNVGHALESQAQYTEALEYFLQAVKVQDDDIGAHINVGRTYNNLGRFKEAEEAYLKAKSLLPRAKPGESYQARIAPNHLNVFLNLANLIARNETRLGEADALYRQAISMRADYTQAYINRGDILIKMNRTKEAQEVYEKALFYDRNNPDIYYNLGVVLLEQGKPSQALAYLERALELEPDHQASLLNSAIVLQEMAANDKGHQDNAESDSSQSEVNVEVTQWRRREATKRLKHLLQLDPINERALFNLGMLAMDNGDMPSAEHYFKGSVLLKPNFRSALFNLALLLSDTGRPLEAVPFLKQLVHHHQDHIKGLILLGDIYINSMKDLEAAEGCYIRILELDPMNVQGQHNLCVVYVERGDLSAAEKCLQQAHRLAPHEDYIVRHLNIVQTRIAKLIAAQQKKQQQKKIDKKDQHL